MTDCDICLEKPVVKEAIYYDDRGNLIIFSLCNSPECDMDAEFSRVTNYIHLDNTSIGSVE